MNKEYIVFDFDNTVVNSLDLWYKVIDRESFKHFGVKRIKDFKKIRKGLGNNEIARKFLEVTNLSDVTVQDVFDCWFERMSVYYTQKIKIIDGVLEYIKYLKDKGYKIILSSATNADLLKVEVSHLGLDKYFEEIYTEQIFGISKKCPEYYKNLLQRLNT